MTGGDRHLAWFLVPCYPPCFITICEVLRTRAPGSVTVSSSGNLIHWGLSFVVEKVCACTLLSVWLRRGRWEGDGGMLLYIATCERESVCMCSLSMGTHQGHTVLCAVWWKRMESVGTIAKCLL